MRRTQRWWASWAGIVVVALLLVALVRTQRDVPTDAVQGEWGLAGDGNTTTEAFPLPVAPITFTVQCQCHNLLRARLLAADGSSVVLLGEGPRPPALRKTVDIERAGDYVVEVEADGAWELTVQPETVNAAR